ncbi:MAG: 50S ribosomal protein L6 [Nitrospinaceae bacterium]|nr:50S ribosomal protein L6 [Nitrospinaceae bacterium]NIR55544.1 50S ribosomal protein L6 [Nitrospinaceae bacterium]NIS85978.1 50S ribosomal protein L6 [Nitrospinaceae bacterium]NIT82824.1 50S ribosomal protein L6 [Nitrospinaceae bacterium]NIU45026.1 50S ribosomal protein L6 [Nitrospinaceae bacterium]
MSRIGKKPVPVPSGVEVKIDGSKVSVKGPKGELSQEFNPAMTIENQDGQVVVTRPDDTRTHRAVHGLTRALINNMVTGVSEGFLKQLNIVGVGYKVELKGKDLKLHLGFSHPVDYPAPPGIEFEVDPKANFIKIKGIDKQQVGQVSAEIRKFRPPEPYKGKGVMYSDERIRRKAGKAAAGAK